MKPARRIKPSAEYLNQGSEAFVAGRFYLAAQAFAKALKAEPRNPVVLFNLASAKEQIGEIETAAQLLTEALRYRPSWMEPAQRLARLLGRFKLQNTKDFNAHGLLAAFAFEKIDDEPLASAALAYLEAKSSLGQTVGQAASGEADVAARTLLLRRTAKPLAHPLLLAAFDSVNHDPRWERLLTAMRRVLLLEIPAERFEDKALTTFILALLRQCLANEYVFAVSDQEERCLAENRIDWPSLAAGEAEQVRSLVLHLLYQSPHDVIGDKISPTECRRLRPRPLGEWLAQILQEEEQQIALAADIPAISPIKDAVSRKVAGQYEAHPYPRWTRLQMPRESSGRAMLERFYAPEKLAFLDKPFKVLIAGAGTGRQAIAAAVRYGPLADVLAVDLSRRSLAYGKAKAQHLGVTNIRFAQADLLQLGHEEGPFDIIEAVGVLHHMAEPFKAWQALAAHLRPGGLMHTGLYSAISRRHIVQLRSEADYPGPGCDDRRARAYRNSLMNREDEVADDLKLSHDFYTLSEFRDLVLHEHERPIFLSEIEAFMRQNARRFCGFNLPRPAVDAFFEAFPDDEWPGKFSNWEAFEETHPHTFDTMYRFWCEPAAQLGK